LLAPPAERLPNVEYVAEDIRDSGLVRALFERHRPTHILHLAAILSRCSEEARRLAWTVNASSTFELFECALEFQLGRSFCRTLAPLTAFRSLRLPVVISRNAPAAALTAYASHAFIAAAARLDWGSSPPLGTIFIRA